MANKTQTGETGLLLRILRESYDQQSWHGPNLRGAVRRVTANVAGWRPAPGRKSIAEHVAHAAYWKYAAHRRLTGGKRGSFPLKGSNWFAISDALSAIEWKGLLKLLDEQHKALVTAIEVLPARQLDVVPRGAKITNRQLIYGVALHDVYHAGQVQLIKRLQNR